MYFGLVSFSADVMHMHACCASIATHPYKHTCYTSIGFINTPLYQIRGSSGIQVQCDLVPTNSLHVLHEFWVVRMSCMLTVS